MNTIGNLYTQEARGILSGVGQVDYKVSNQLELDEIIGRYDAALVGLGLLFDRRVLKAAKKLKVIATATTGLDHIDLETAKEQGITVLSLRDETEFLKTITSTAELAWGLMLDLARRTPMAFDAVKRYEWQREDFRGNTFQGKTLGIVGMGRLGTWMARYGLAFGMQITFYDPYVNAAQGLSLLHAGGTVPAATNIPLQLMRVETLEALLRQSDIISVHTHLTPETENMFDKSAFGKMKPTAYLINTARGKIINEQDLLTVLEEKAIAGYATDVLAGEQDFSTNGFSNHPLIEYAKTHDNCIITPHIGGMTHESRRDTDIVIAKKLKNYLEDLPQ